jgi:hypothetical protein
MAQTNLKSDDFCGYNQSAAPFYYMFQPGQYENTFVYGEVGVSAAGGTGGSYVRSDLIGISSFLSGRDDILTKCNPPTPDLDSLNEPRMSAQNNASVELLVPAYTKEKRSAVGLDAIDYNRWQPDLPVNPQNLRHIVEDFAPQRGGLNTTNFVKLSWNKYNNGLGGVGIAEAQDPNLAKLVLDPSRACGPKCSDITGYYQTAMAPGKPPGQPEYPFTDITSQQLYNVGAAPCGPQFFYGQTFDEGSCPTIVPQVLTENTSSFKF